MHVQGLAIEYIDGNNIVLQSGTITVKDKLAAAAWLQENHPESSAVFVSYGTEPVKTATVRLRQYGAKAQKLAQAVKQVIVKAVPPPFYKNSHCAECQFWKTCYSKLAEKDCISLLAGMSPKVLAKYHTKGLFTITQLSYLFRPRRRGRQLANNKYLWELKALAIREQKTFVLQTPEQDMQDTQIFIDFEGIPDEKYIYLIGVLVTEKDKPARSFSFWADNKQREEEIFARLLGVIKAYPEANVYHYSAYETKALKKTAGRHFARLEKRMSDLLVPLRTQVYPPTYGNGLKELAGFLGFQWSDAEAGGMQSIIWRKNWETTKEPRWKEKLLRYNMDDCGALLKVFGWLQQLAVNALPGVTQQVSQMKKGFPYRWQSNNDYSDDFDYINKAAYFDYQRSKVYWRYKPNAAIKNSVSQKHAARHRGKGHDGWQPKQVNEVVIAPPLKECPFCGHKKLYQGHSRQSWIQTDLKFTATGIRQYVTEYQSAKGKCANCGKKHNNAVLRRPRYGDNLFAWVTNLYVTYHVSNWMVSRLLEEQFGIWANPMYLVMHKRRWWKQWQPEAGYIKQTVLSSPVLHIDETPVKLVKEHGYVWVFATPHTVYYHLSLTREGAFLQEWLKEYKGVIVTDFFPAYDALPVKRQKCLIHLIRDLNDDLFKSPFDHEFKDLVTAFGRLLKNIIDTVDLHGLKKAKLQKHGKDTAVFYAEWVEKPATGELSAKYVKRFKKHWPELWTFLEHDNVPWNNNNAEAAIKAFAQYRRGVNGQVSESGLTDYLRMLSLAQTCRYRDVSFLDFLRLKTGIWEKADAALLPGFLPFRQGRLFARSLKIQGRQDWVNWLAAGKCPAFIPPRPNIHYRNGGWKDWEDWLGSGYWPFPQARAYVRRLGLKNKTAYAAWLRSGKCPACIPRHPENVYRHTGWLDIYDWIGGK